MYETQQKPSNGLKSATSAREMSEVEREHNALENALNSLEDRIAQLFQRLQSGGVTFPMPAQGETAPPMPPDCGSKLGTQLHVAARRVSTLESTLVSLVASLAI